MKVDFFRYEQPVSAVRFGICDDPDPAVKTPAYVDSTASHEAAWGATVTNVSGLPVKFIPVDNNIDILRPNGEMENRCDAIAHNGSSIAFIELKNQKSDWLQHAVWDQLSSTVKTFGCNHNLTAFSSRRAYACNRRHPRFHYSNKTDRQRFFNLYGVILEIGCDIKL